VKRLGAVVGAFLIVVVGAGLYAWTQRAPTAPPSSTSATPADDRSGGAILAGPDVAQGSASNSSNPRGRDDSASTTAVRVAVAPDVEASCELEIHVTQPDSGQATPVAFVELTVHLEDAPEIRGEGSTDETGTAKFVFVGGSGRTVVVRTATGATGEAILDQDRLVRVAVHIDPLLILAGEVVDPQERPVAGADLVLVPWPAQPHYALDTWRIGRSGPDGRFRIALRASGYVGATHPEHVASWLSLIQPRITQPGSIPTQSLTLRLSAAGVAIHGTVTDPEGRAVGGAAIEFHAVAARLATQATSAGGARTGPASLAGPPRRVISNRDGDFRCDNLPRGSVRWFARKQGYGWSQGTALVGDDHELQIRLPPSATLRGTVVDQPSGEPIEDATVLVGMPHTLGAAETRSAADGTYVLHDLGVGPTRVVATYQQRSAEITVDLSGGGESVWHARLERDRSLALRGTVVDPQNRPLKGWTVLVRQPNHDPVSAATNPQGAFVIPLQEQADLDVRVFAPGKPGTAFADLTRRGVDARAPVQFVVHVRETTTVTGRLLDSNAAGAAGVIGCWHHDHREYARFQADQDGAFAITCPVGTVDLTFTHPAHVVHSSRGLQLQPNLPADLGTITLTLGGGLFGTVMTPGGGAPPPCELHLLTADGAQLRAEYNGGSYRFEQAPPGKHTLVVQGEGIAGASFPLTITAGVDLPRDIEVQQGLHRIVRVTVPPEAGTHVTLVVRGPNAGTQWYAHSQVQRDAGSREGHCLFETWMAAGVYEVVAVTPEGYEARATARYEGDDQAPLVLPLKPR